MNYGIISSQNRFKIHEKERKRKLLFRFVLTRRVIENSRKIAKKLKNTIMDSFQDKIGRKMLRKSENKKYHFVSSLPGS